MAKQKVLFLDDMESRHQTFRKVVRYPFRTDVEIDFVYTAADAIRLLTERKYDQVYLDHDLSEDDIMMEVGATGLKPTGMTVVDHIVESGVNVPWVCIHSCNGPAAREMNHRLQGSPNVGKILELAFPWLMHDIEISYRAEEPATFSGTMEEAIAYMDGVVSGSL